MKTAPKAVCRESLIRGLEKVRGRLKGERVGSVLRLDPNDPLKVKVRRDLCKLLLETAGASVSQPRRLGDVVGDYIRNDTPEWADIENVVTPIFVCSEFAGAVTGAIEAIIELADRSSPDKRELMVRRFAADDTLGRLWFDVVRKVKSPVELLERTLEDAREEVRSLLPPPREE